MATRFRSQDGMEWEVTLDAPGQVMSVAPELERSGAMLPEHAVRIVFTSGDTQVSDEYTAMTPVEDLSDDELDEWFQAARRGQGL